MTIRKYHLAAAGAALAAAVALVACGSSSAPPGTSGSTTPQPTATTPAAAPTTVTAADVAFTTGMLRLENQAAALAALVPAHTTTAQLRQFAVGLDEHAAEFQQMRGMMGQWGRAAPAPYTPGATPPAGTGPGMLGPGGWDEMGHMHGGDFNDHFADAMIANRTAETALCRAELSHGASPQARALARTMLTQRQAELTQLQAWHHQWEHSNDHDMMHG
ncbi:MAG TPA: DUF305 domain-containing protein [Streptosporangiaceae bacterium]|nr:DUF305 domain-containing protein [Streptosporangiaceae bacterium]